jgi:hypothetical protein
MNYDAKKGLNIAIFGPWAYQLGGLFEGLDGKGLVIPLADPFFWKEADCSQMELFDESGKKVEVPKTLQPSGNSRTARRLFELSANAFDALVHAWMSALPLEAEMIRFGRKVLAAGEAAGKGLPPGEREEAERRAAKRTASDQGDPDTRVVLETAWKVGREIHRIMGFLRFSPRDGVYSARCRPDYFILPALAEHFTLRFGETPWEISDEKRGLRLCRRPGGEARLLPARSPLPAGREDPWEDLWRLYHRSVNNETRKNPTLQHQFMPGRYQKYLTELGKP